MTEYKVYECGGRHAQFSNLPGQNKNYNEIISQDSLSPNLDSNQALSE